MDNQNAWPEWIPMLRGWRAGPEPAARSEFQRWPVYRETARFKRKVGYLDGNFRPEEDEAPPLPVGVTDVLTRLFRRGKRLDENRLFAALAPAAAALALTPDSLARQLVNKGWLGRWVRLQADEKSVSGVEYGPLAPLTALLRSGRNEVWSEHAVWLRDMLTRLEQLSCDSGTEQEEGPDTMLQPVREALEQAREYLSRDPESLGCVGGLPALHPLFPWTFHPLKPRGKFHLGVEFLLALAGCARSSPEGFEWKEIGARFEPGIGASKRFDAARQDLLGLAETVCGMPPEELGLTSTGSLYCLYFLGPLQAHFSAGSLTAGPAVNALTNVQLRQLTGLATTAERVVLTENRALLLKMASTGWAAEDPPTLVLGIDGSLRLAHTSFLRLLRRCRADLLWFVWVDTDTAGQAIAGQIAALNPHCRFLLPGAGTAVEEYASWRRALQDSSALWNREQEDSLGHPRLWHEWFKT